eukprot:scaffold14091_cov28-Tisochrysis_lutea.AAC.7
MAHGMAIEHLGGRWGVGLRAPASAARRRASLLSSCQEKVLGVFKRLSKSQRLRLTDRPQAARRPEGSCGARGGEK